MVSLQHQIKTIINDMNDNIRMRNDYVIFTVQRASSLVNQIIVDIINESSLRCSVYYRAVVDNWCDIKSAKDVHALRIGI